MLACRETVTLVHHEVETEADRYTCTVIHGASWYSKIKVELQKNGLVHAKEVKIRIPEVNMPEGAEPCESDFMIRGEALVIEKQSDLEQYEYIRIMAVGDNRRGGIPHWGVNG